jgi:hypothetical protein
MKRALAVARARRACVPSTRHFVTIIFLTTN